MFIDAYGAEAGNLALRSVATAGVYIGGGIAPKILPALTRGAFMDAFLDKEPMVDMLRTLPVSVILNPAAGLLGAAVRAASSLFPIDRVEELPGLLVFRIQLQHVLRLPAGLVFPADRIEPDGVVHPDGRRGRRETGRFLERSDGVGWTAEHRPREAEAIEVLRVLAGLGRALPRRDAGIDAADVGEAERELARGLRIPPRGVERADGRVRFGGPIEPHTATRTRSRVAESA